MGPIWDAELRVWDAKNFGLVSPGTHRNKFVKKSLPNPQFMVWPKRPPWHFLWLKCQWPKCHTFLYSVYFQFSFLYIQTLHNGCSDIEDVHWQRRSRAEFGLVIFYLTVYYQDGKYFFCLKSGPQDKGA